MAASDVKKIYEDVIDDVCSAVRDAIIEEGYDDHTLQELKNLWLERLRNSKALEPQHANIVDQATMREYRHPAAGDSGHASKLQTASLRQINSRPQQASNAGVPNFPTNYTPGASINPSLLTNAAAAGTTQLMRTAFPARSSNPTNVPSTIMKTANQLDGACDEERTKKTKSRKRKAPVVEVSFQLDGTGPPVGDDDDDEEDSDLEGVRNEAADEIDDDDDEDGTEEGREDPNPLCSDDDVSDDEPTELFETENVVVCQYDKITRTKNKWRFVLKSGVMHIEGRDYVFSKANGEADW